MSILEHEGNVENRSRRRVFSTFLECSLMSGVFYHSVIHGSTAALLAQLVEHRTAVREVAASNLDRINTQGLIITKEKVLPL